jgi:hypothetical protein
MGLHLISVLESVDQWKSRGGEGPDTRRPPFRRHAQTESEFLQRDDKEGRGGNRTLPYYLPASKFPYVPFVFRIRLPYPPPPNTVSAYPRIPHPSIIAYHPFSLFPPPCPAWHFLLPAQPSVSS